MPIDQPIVAEPFAFERLQEAAVSRIRGGPIGFAVGWS
jgi:hypothetical protein